jgi:hypothetical protein
LLYIYLLVALYLCCSRGIPFITSWVSMLPLSTILIYDVEIDLNRGWVYFNLCQWCSLILQPMSVVLINITVVSVIVYYQKSLVLRFPKLSRGICRLLKYLPFGGFIFVLLPWNSLYYLMGINVASFYNFDI